MTHVITCDICGTQLTAAEKIWVYTGNETVKEGEYCAKCWHSKTNWLKIHQVKKAE